MKPAKRKSLRETFTENNAALQMYAALAGKPVPDGVLTPVKPKRIRSSAAQAKVGRGSEHNEQCAVIHWWKKWCHKFDAVPEELFAIPNGGARDIITASRLKAEGVRRGTLDLCLAVPFGGKHSLWIEMKYNNGRLTDEQKEFIERAEKRGYATAVCWTAEEAIEAIKEYFCETK